MLLPGAALVTGLGSQGAGAALRACYARCLAHAVAALSQPAGGLGEDEQVTFSQQVRGVRPGDRHHAASAESELCVPCFESAP